MAWRGLVVLAACLVVPVGAARAVSSQTPYQTAATATSCSGKNSCTIVFAPIPTSQNATIEHVSCNATFGNFQALYLVTLVAQSTPTVADSLSTTSYTINANGGAESIVDTPTLFTVASGDSPNISLMASGPFSGEPTCFVSGYLAPTTGKR